MKVFIAGGSGRVAAAVIQELVNRGQQVYAGPGTKTRSSNFRALLPSLLTCMRVPLN